MNEEHPSSHAVSPAPRRAAVAFILVTAALDILALGVIIPVLPHLVQGFIGGDTALAARVMGLFGTVWALLQFLCSPILGALSDRYGRRPVILGSNLGLGLDYIIMALAPNIYWLFVGRVLSGVSAASISTAFAYIADVTPLERRSESYGLMGAAFGLGFVIGPALGGLAGSYDLRLPFWIAGALSLLNAVYGYFVLPESLPRERRAPLVWQRANPLGAIKLLNSTTMLRTMGLILFLGSLAHEVLPSVYVLYTSYRYQWGEKAVGFSLAAVGIASAYVQAVLMGRLLTWLGDEWRTLFFGLFFGVLGFYVYGLADHQELFFVGILLTSLWGVAGAAEQSMLSSQVSPSQQGQLQGAIASIRSLASMMGPGIFSFTFAHFIEPSREFLIPGAPFYFSSMLLFLSMVVALVLRLQKPDSLKNQ